MREHGTKSFPSHWKGSFTSCHFKICMHNIHKLTFSSLQDTAQFQQVSYGLSAFLNPWILGCSTSIPFLLPEPACPSIPHRLTFKVLSSSTASEIFSHQITSLLFFFCLPFSLVKGLFSMCRWRTYPYPSI